MRSREYLLLVTILFAFTVTPHNVSGASESAYILKFTVSTDSDWSTIALRLGSLLLWEMTVDRGPEECVTAWADDALHLSISKAAYDSSTIQVTLEALVLSGGEAVEVAVEKGSIGETRIRVYGWTMGRYLLLKRINHGSVPGDPALNRGVYTVSAEALRYSRVGVERRGEEPPRMVHAVYYPWYGNPSGPSSSWSHWSDVTSNDSGASVHFPLLGAYDSLDPAIIEAHIAMAKDAGLDGFLCSWWGPGSREDQALGLMLEAAERLGFKVGAYYESIREGVGPLAEEIMVEDLCYIVGRYSEEECYLKVGDTPVVFVYGAQAEGRDEALWRRVKGEVEARVGEVMLVGDMRDPGLLRALDGMHVYNELDASEHGAITEIIAGSRWVLEEPDLAAVKARVKSEGVLTLRRKLAVGTVLPGYDDTETRSPGAVLPRDGSETYKGYWSRIAGSGVDWVMVTSWNEWHEGTEVEPSVEERFLALQTTRSNAHLFKGQVGEEAYQPEIRAEAEPGSENVLVRLSNFGSGTAYALTCELSRAGDLIEAITIPCIGPGESKEHSLTPPEADTSCSVRVTYYGFTGERHEKTIIFTSPPGEAEEPTAPPVYLYPPQPEGERVWLSLRGFEAEAGYGTLHVEASVDVLCDPAEVEYCSLDVLVDGEVVYGECWSSLPEVSWGHPALTAPQTMAYEVDVPLEPGVHTVYLRSYARNARFSAVYTGEPITVTVPSPYVDVQVTRFTAREVSGYLLVELEAHVESDPPLMEYCSLTLLYGDSIIGGVCWTDIPGLGGYRAVAAPVNLHYTCTVPVGLKDLLYAVAYARNMAGSFAQARLDEFTR